MTDKARRIRSTQLDAVPADEERLVLATGRYIGEGFDDERLDTHFFALPASWKSTLVQFAGRLHRPPPGKTEVRIYDHVDRNVLMLLKMFEKRQRAYRAIGHEEEQRASSRPLVVTTANCSGVWPQAYLMWHEDRGPLWPQRPPASRDLAMASRLLVVAAVHHF